MTIEQLLGDEADSLLNHTAKAFPAEHLNLPGPDHLDQVFMDSDRSATVLRNLGTVYGTGRLGGTGYLSILPVDQGIEHSAAASFAKIPAYFDPAKLCELAIAGDCNAIATTLGGLGIVSRRYVHKIPFIVKLNHNDFLNYPNTYDQVMFGSVSARPSTSGPSAWGPPSTSAPRRRPPDRTKCREPSPRPTGSGCSPSCGATCGTRPSRQGDADYHLSADLTGQANHLGVTIEADIIKQKQPENNGGYNALKFGKTDPARLQPAHHRPPHRPHPLAGGQLLCRADPPHQLGRRVQGRRRPGPGRPHRGHQQAGRRVRAHRGPQGLPAAHR